MNTSTVVDPTVPIVEPTPEVVAGLDYWRSLPVKQQPSWVDKDKATTVISELHRVPPLVFAGEADNLRTSLAAVAEGKAFVLQGGDLSLIHI